MSHKKLPIELCLKFIDFEEVEYLIKYLREDNPNRKLTLKLSSQLVKARDRKKASIEKKKKAAERKLKGKETVLLNLKKSQAKRKIFEEVDLISPDYRILDVAKKYRDELVEKQTDSEKIIKAHLKSLNVKFEFQYIVFIDDNKFFIVDFFLPDYNIVLEIDGGYHSEIMQKIKDEERIKRLRKLGIKKVERLTNFECVETEFTRNKIVTILNKYCSKNK